MTHSQTQGADGAGTTAKQVERVSLADCPIGLFLAASGALCLKTEYGDNEGRIDAYIVESGEFFWGGSPQSIPSQRRQMVTPVPLEQIADAIHLPFKKMVYATPAPAATPGVPDSVREAAATLIADLDRSLVSSRDHAVIAATNASVKRLRALIAAQPAGQAGDAGEALDMPLAEDVQFPGVKFGKGVALRTVIEAARRWKADADAAFLARIPAPNSTRTGAAEIDRAIVSALNAVDIVEEAESYEFRPDVGCHTPNEFEKVLLIDFAQGLMNAVHQAVRPLCLAARPEAPSDAGYQDRAEKWLAAVTEGDPTDLAERRDRFSEEAMELVQSLGATREGMHELIDYVFDRPVGEPGDEMGDTKLCMANLASWAKLDMDACGEAMLARRSKPESVAKIRRKRSTRHGRGPLPGFTPPSDPAPSGQAEG